MVKNNKKHNILIKRNRLVARLNEAGIRRASPDALALIESHLGAYLDSLITQAKEEMTSCGRKTLKAEDIENALLNTPKKDEAWEI